MKQVEDVIKRLTNELCELEADKYYFNIAYAKKIISKEQKDTAITEINEKIKIVNNEIKRLSQC